MDQNMIEKYKKEMLEMYKSVKPAVPVQTTQVMPTPPAEDTSSGKLIGLITAIRSLYPVPNAKVTVFEGSTENPQVVATAFTDSSGRTDAITLPTPEKSLSLDQNNTIIPYAVYNMRVDADGYISNIHLNVPIFSGVTSLQRSNLMLTETSGEDKGPRIFDESENYDL